MWEKNRKYSELQEYWGTWVWEKIIREKVMLIFTLRNKRINRSWETRRESLKSNICSMSSICVSL